MALNLANIEQALESLPAGGRLLDLGCDDGALTLKFAEAARAPEVYGVELVQAAANAARERGISVTEADLNHPLPFRDGEFDVVVSNQVIEHLVNTDTFVSEIGRILSPRGVAVTSTENLASWHNIAALALGWQPFSLSNVTKQRSGLGNPLAIHRQEETSRETWQHVKVFSYRGLRELFESHGLTVRAILGAGYYPLATGVGKLEPRHAAFLTVVAFAG
jgi:2-polyprenyl-3-methyl-5-hydroxy-6-metoxy-1,4-benzoquinol methylase